MNVWLWPSAARPCQEPLPDTGPGLPGWAGAAAGAGCGCSTHGALRCWVSGSSRVIPALLGSLRSTPAPRGSESSSTEGDIGDTRTKLRSRGAQPGTRPHGWDVPGWAELGVVGSRGAPLLALSPQLSQEAAQGWGLQHKRIHTVGTLSDSLGAVSPPPPHRAAGFPLSPQQVSPSRSRPQTCPFLQTAPAEGPTGGNELQPPPRVTSAPSPTPGWLHTGSPTGCCHQSPPW